ncbi:MAG: hypothetical protein PHV02_03250 [Rhodocyclaceae bacterium]|nr:hypothetical protein [Rhodocyclaceae bacterium]
MGGKALSCGSVRLPKSQYETLASRCIETLQRRFPGRKMAALGSYKSKPDFGDCDLLIEGGEGYNAVAAAEALGAVEVVRNGPVTSVGVLVSSALGKIEGNIFQVDLISIDPEAFHFAKSYFGHGDTGNLLGRIFHAAGMALRHDGLFYYVRFGDHKFREILLTRDFSEALRVMDFDPSVLDRGFDTPEDIFRYVAASKFFNVAIFLLENRNARSRVRDKKRPLYTQFLQWYESQVGHAAFAYPQDKGEWLPRISAHFPGFAPAYQQAHADMAELKAVKGKFNGEWVAAITGLRGKELGVLMRRFSQSFDSAEAMRSYIVSHDKIEIEVRIRGLLDQ